MKYLISVTVILLGAILFAGDKEDALQKLDEQKSALEAQKLAIELEIQRTIEIRELVEKLEDTTEPPTTPGVVDFSVIAMRLPRDINVHPILPRADDPFRIDPGTDLVIIDPNGNEEVLVDADFDEVAMDPQVSFDGKTLFYTLAKKVNPEDNQNYLDIQSNIYMMNLESREITQVTHQDGGERGNTILDSGPSPLGDDRIIFTSNRAETFRGSHYRKEHILQLFVVDRDGTNIEKIGYLNLHGALHPMPLPDGRYMWSSGEGMGVRTPVWGLWVSHPDGTNWGPLFSAFGSTSGLPFPTHFQAALPDNKIVLAKYYQTKNWGTGIILQFDPTTGFGSPDRTQQIPYRDSRKLGSHPFMPNGTISLTPHSTSKDVKIEQRDDWDGEYVGKWSHPAAAPGGMLATWTGNSPSNIDYLPTIKGTICYIPGPKPVETPADFQIIKQSEEYNYIQPVPVVTYREIHGIDKPVKLPWLPQDRHVSLPLGTPYGIIGTDSFYTRESASEGGYEPWVSQGSDIYGGYDNSEIEYVRILLQELSSPIEIGQKVLAKTESYGNIVAERLKILPDIPLRKYNEDGTPILDSNGDPDTSFLVKLPADQAFTFQMLDKNHQVLSMAQTWHQLRPGEVRTDCKGCHAHHEPSTVAFSSTWAAKNPPVDLTKITPTGYDWVTHIKPIFEKHCIRCHDGENEETDLDLTHNLNMNRKYSQTQPFLPYQSRNSHIVQRIQAPIEDDNHMPQDGGMLSDEEINTIIQWIETGTQSDRSNVDDTLPTVHIETPRRRTEPINEIRFGTTDLYGIETISVRTSWLVGEQIQNFTDSDSVYTMQLQTPIPSGVVTVVVIDKSGNTKTVERSFNRLE
ncbi:c-type cytochrome [bacterium]|nr:c-type cytochrome [bacterium]